MGIVQNIAGFFRLREAKANPAYLGMISYSDTPKPVSMPKNYKSFAKEGYRGNDTAFKCIAYIARNGAAIPPVLYASPKRDKVIESHTILELLNKPNNEQTGVAYREAALAYKLLSGNSFQYAVRLGKEGPPAELWTLRPDLVQVIPAPRRGIVGYKYEYMEAPILPQNIHHSKYFNPDDDHYGLSPLEVGAVLIDQQKAAKLWNLALLQNSARPPGAWVVPTPLSKNDREKLEERLRQKLQGYKNAGTPPVLDAGLTWQSMALAPESLDWLEGIQYNAASIANLFNIPPQLIGDNSATTYNNMEQAKAASYTEAIFPELDDFYAGLDSWLIPMYPDLANSGACLGYDKDTVEVVRAVVQAQEEARKNRAKDLFMNGLATLNEAREIAGLSKVPGGDVYRIGAILVPSDELEKYAEQSLTTPAGPPMQVAEPVAQNAQAAQGQQPPAQDSSKKPDEKPPTGKKADPGLENSTNISYNLVRTTVQDEREQNTQAYRQFVRATNV